MRTLVLSPDWNASLCWHDAEGCGAADESALQLSEELRKHLEDYYAWWSELHLAEDRCPVSCTDWRLLDERGFQLWQRLRAELRGRCQVHFYSHEFKETFEDPERFRKITRHENAEQAGCTEPGDGALISTEAPKAPGR